MPRGAGLSSSAALEVALALALSRSAGAGAADRLGLAQLCSRVENEWVGARTGLLDQIASLFGEPRRALLIDFRSLESGPCRSSSSGCTLVTLDSGERHANASSGYNRRREECAQACAALGVASLRDATLEAAEGLPEPWRAAPATCSARTRGSSQMVAALERGELEEAGRLLDASHASLRDSTRSRRPRSSEPWRGCTMRARSALGSSAAGSAVTCSGCCLPTRPCRPDAHVVAPGPGASLRQRTSRSAG